MIFQSIKLTNFKCYEQADAAFHPVLNCIIGNNGAGKTNLLDALYYTCFTKSYFSSRDQFLYRQGSAFFRIAARIEHGERFEVVIKAKENSGKSIAVNDRLIERRSDLIGKFNAVMIAPDDNQIILGGSELRRKFLDGCIGQYDREYLGCIMTYQKLLRQRNAVLKQYRKSGRLDATLLETLDERMDGPADIIYKGREAFIEAFTPVFEDRFTAIAGNKEEVSIVYDRQDAGSLLENLRTGRQQDLQAGRTGFGPHKDDLQFSIFERPLKNTGSQGQQKSYLVALKLAQYFLIESRTGHKPFLFLDDLMDKFDPERVEHIMQMIDDGLFGQVFITDTSADRLEVNLKKHKLEYRMIRVENALIKA